MIQTLFGAVEQEPSLLEKLKSGVQKTRAGLVSALEDAIQGKKDIDADLLDELEYTLISADIGVGATEEILDAHPPARGAASGERRGRAARADPRAPARDSAGQRARAGAASRSRRPWSWWWGSTARARPRPSGSWPQRFKSEGRSTLLCAADTFRAAAIEQLEIWGQRTGTTVIRQSPGSDPSAVLFDALQAARARKVDCVIVDTAGRLQTKENLMAELQKMSRTAQKVIPDAPHEVLLVLDATTGQNGLEQARKFTETSGVTGIVLTKLDGTAKGGIVVAIARELNLPIRYVGVGEKVDDLLPFDAEKFIESLFEK